MSLRAILVATDLSPDSRAAAMRGAQLARQAGAARLALAYVLGATLPPGFEEQVLAQARRALGEAAEDAARASGVPAEPILARGNAVDRIHEAAAAFDLVVAGARGEDALLDMALGRTSVKLARRIDRPLLVARRADAAAYAKVLVATDLSGPGADALALASAVAPQAGLHFAHAFEPEFESSLRLAGVTGDKLHAYRREARDRAAAGLEAFVAGRGLAGPRGTRSVVQGFPSRAIVEEAERVGADLIVLGKHSRGTVESWVLGSVAHGVLEHARGDVLVVP